MARAKKKPSFAKQLEKIVKEIPEEQRVFGEKLAAEIEWMAGTLTELKNIVDEQGAVITTTNGNGFEVMTENPAQKSYNTMIKNYTAAIKQLTGSADYHRKYSRAHSGFQSHAGPNYRP